MSRDEIIVVVKNIIAKLIDGQYDKLEEQDYARLLTSSEIKLAIEECPGRISMPPDTAFQSMNVYGNKEDEKSIDMDLWFDGKQSDLTLSCRFLKKNGIIVHGIEGIHIL